MPVHIALFVWWSIAWAGTASLMFHPAPFTKGHKP